ncbi:hypothetical protein ACGF1Z_16170 [Streptomyces sp. NPDC048018]|uniref:hypothetical protein n=1 Tax=Streptomyces sp. NPDC048018 TaxID=3365499 RepID=UPI003710966D
MSQYDTGGAEPPRSRRRHASKRRGPGPLWTIGSGAVVVIGVLAAMTSLDSGPAGPAPAVDEGHPGMPALIQRDEGAPDGDGESPGPTASAHPARPSGAASTAPAPTAAAPAAATSTGATPTTSPSPQHPGRSGSAPGAKKKQR